MRKFIDRPRYLCALGGALATLRAIPRAVPILHASAGCGGNLATALNGGSGIGGNGYCGGQSLPSSNVTEKEVVFCGTHDNYFLKHMEEIYGIPYIIDTMPVGKRNTARWIRKIAAFFGLENEAEKLIEAEEKQLDEALKPYIEYFKGKKAYLVVGDVRVLTTAEAFQNLGFEVVGMKAYHIDEYAVPALDAVDKVDEIPINVAMGHTFEITNVVKRVKPDIFVTHPGGQNTTARYGIPIYPAFGPGIYNGYAGLFSIARGVKRALENGQYNKLIAKHRRLPYTKEWYEKDPAYYITELDDFEK